MDLVDPSVPTTGQAHAGQFTDERREELRQLGSRQEDDGLRMAGVEQLVVGEETDDVRQLMG